MNKEKRLCLYAIGFHLAAVVFWCYLKQHTDQPALGLLIGWSVWSGAKATSSLMQLSGGGMAR
jgi:hypothetical protein